jgi:anti-sigma28 factor (negative regulator of flagellin synthesis)
MVKRPERPATVQTGQRHAENDSQLIGPIQPIGEGKRHMRLSEIQEQIGSGEYRVDNHAVADAMLRRLLPEHKLASANGKPPQEECS